MSSQSQTSSTAELARLLNHWEGSTHLRPPASIGPYWYRWPRSAAPALCNRILDHYKAIIRQRPECSGSGWEVWALARGFLRWTRQSRLHLARYGHAARREFGRSHTQQLRDHWRVWCRRAVSPWEYYDGQLARHKGDDCLENYLNFQVLTTVLIDIQLRLLGPLEMRVSDKLKFHQWCQAHQIPCASQVSIPSGQSVELHALETLGPSMIIKPRTSFGGHDIESLTAQPDGVWTIGQRELNAPQLCDYLAGLANRLKPGILVQNRLFNPPGLGLEDLALSTCRVFTMLNEQGLPEVVEAFRRVPKNPDVVVDNYSSGGDCWMAGEFENGTIALGLGHQSTPDQTLLSADPQRPEFAIGKPIPDFHDFAAFALTAHARAPKTLAISWDVAKTCDGMKVIEANFPPSMVTQWQLLDNGFAHSRVAQLYAHWLDRLEALDNDV